MLYRLSEKFLQSMEAGRSAFAFPGSICGRTRLTKEDIQSQNVKPLKQQRTYSLNSARDSATEFQYCEQYAENEENIWKSQYLLQSGGKIVFSLTANSTFSIRLCPASQATNDNTGKGEAKDKSKWLGFRINRKTVDLVYSSGKGLGLNLINSCHEEVAGFREGHRKLYWVSLDPHKMELKFGQQSPYMANALLTCSLGPEDLHKHSSALYSLLENLQSSPVCIELNGFKGPAVYEASTFEQPLLQQRSDKVCWAFIDREPVVLDLSPRLMPNKAMQLSDLSQLDITFKSSLCHTGQIVADQVLQPGLTLSTISPLTYRSLADAIRFNLKSEGSFLNHLLNDKCLRLGTPRKETQISIELAPALGNSPGPAITLEILPRGFSGPAMCNARAHGALRVLHGAMDVSLYNDELEYEDVNCPFDEVELEREDAFWFSPRWYQTHAVTNASSSFCAYIVARKYDEKDEIRCPNFYGKDIRGKSCTRTARADCLFSEFAEKVSQELADALQKSPECLHEDQEESELDRTTSSRTEAWVEGSDKPREQKISRDEGILEKKSWSSFSLLLGNLTPSSGLKCPSPFSKKHSETQSSSIPRTPIFESIDEPLSLDLVTLWP